MDDADAQAAFVAAVQEMQRAADGVRDCTYVFHQQEHVGGQLRPAQTMEVKYRRDHDVYMKFRSNQQQLLFCSGWNDDKLFVDPGPWVPSLSLDPRGSLAMRNQRHDIYNVGYPATARLFSRDVERILADPVRLDPVVADLGSSVEYGEPVRCFEAVLPKDLEPAFYARKVRACTSEATGLPTRVQAWDLVGGELVLVEDYGYEAAKVNVGLGDTDFDPATYGM